MRPVIVRGMRVLFFGSPDFALPALRALLASGYDVVAVVTQPDRPAGRGRRLMPPPVKALALEHGLRVLQPAKVSAPAVVAELRALAPDVGVLAAYGQLLKPPVLEVPRLGILNIHASLLPRWRGASPVTAAILAGDEDTGATIMRIVPELDAGPVLDAVRLRIDAADTAGTLTARIAEAGAELLLRVLPRYAAGELVPRPQDEALATYAPRVRREDARIEWARESAEQVWRKVRAYNPWPMAWTTVDGAPLRIVEALPLAGGKRYEAEPGTVYTFTRAEEPTLSEAGFCVVTADGDLAVEQVQGAGGRPMRASEYLRGHRELVGKRLGT